MVASNVNYLLFCVRSVTIQFVFVLLDLLATTMWPNTLHCSSKSMRWNVFQNLLPGLLLQE